MEVVEAPSPPVRSGPGALARTASEAIDVTLVGEVRPGDLVLVHAGSALTRVVGHDA